MATEAGPRIDRNKLIDVVERHFDHLVDGNRFDFGPILDALCRVKGVSEANLYIGVVNLQQRLSSLNIEMALPDLKLDQWTRAQLLREAHEATERSRTKHEQSRLQGAVLDLHRARLGDLLVQEGFIEESELAEALEQQRKTGGRLGSNLVQLGFVAESDLSRFLGRQLGLPCVTEIQHISPDARRALPQELLLKHRIVPLMVDAREIQVAMVDPTDLVAIDEIGFVTDRRVRPVVAPELVVDFAQARFFGIRHPPRLISTEDHTPDEGPPSWPRSVYSRNPVVLAAPGDEPYELAEFAHDLLTCEVEDDVYPPLWRLWAERFRLVALMTVSEGMVRGRRLSGADTSTEDFAKATVAACSHPVLDEVISNRKPYRGPSSHSTGSQWLSDQLGLNPSDVVWIAPVVDVSDHAVSLIAGHLPPRSTPDDAWMEAVVTATRATMAMVSARRTLRRVQTDGRPTVHRVQSVV